MEDRRAQHLPTIEARPRRRWRLCPGSEALGKSTLSIDDIVALHQAARGAETGWIRVTAAVERAGFERRIHPASVYGLADYIRYRIRSHWRERASTTASTKSTISCGRNARMLFDVEFNVTRNTFSRRS
jgi:hypothetical protein